MRLKKIVSIVLVISILAFTVTQTAFANQKKENKNRMPPGQFKNMILKSNLTEEKKVELISENADSLSPGVLKEVILGLDLSDESIVKLQSKFNRLPKGILKELTACINNDEEKETEVQGTITNINSNVIEIDDIQYQLNEEVEIKMNELNKDISYLTIGMNVIVEIVKDSVVKISIQSEINKVDGIITDISLDSQFIEVNDVSYQLGDNIIVKFNNELATLNNLEIGMYAKVILNYGVVEVIEAKSVQTKIEGEITDIDLTEYLYLTIDEEKYLLSVDSLTFINGDKRHFKDLELGMKATIYMINSKIVKIEALNPNSKLIFGEIKDINLIAVDYIKVNHNEYKLLNDAIVTIDGYQSTLLELELGMEANVHLENDMVTKIDAYTNDVFENQGLLTNISIEKNTISINDVVYNLIDEPVIFINGVKGSLVGLHVEMQVQVEVHNGFIKAINATSISEEVSGVLTAISLEEGTIDIDNAEYKLLDDIDVITINGVKAQLSELVKYMSIQAKLVNNIVTEIDAEDKVETIAGRVTEVTLTIAGMKLSINTLQDKIVQYFVKEDLQSNYLELLKPYNYVRFKVINDIIVEATIEN